MRLVLVLPVLLSACAGAVSPPVGQPLAPASATRAERIAVECRLLEEAHRQITAQGGAAVPDILVGCPGREALRDAMPLKAQSAALRRANAALLPAAVQAQGPEGARIYRRMITRGVPESLARSLAETPLFAVVAAR